MVRAPSHTNTKVKLDFFGSSCGATSGSLSFMEESPDLLNGPGLEGQPIKETEIPT